MMDLPDNTEKLLEKFKQTITVINLKKNQGKGNALALGIKQAKGDIVEFLDADLTSLSDKHIQLLTTPLLDKQYKAVMGYVVNRSGMSVFADITGQRAYFRKDLLPYLNEISQTRFGVEMFLNGIFKKEETKKVVLPGLKSLLKYQKQTPNVALKEYIKEAVKIVKVFGYTEILSDEDLYILKVLSPNTTLHELKKYIEKIKNKKVKGVLQEYINKYLRLTK